MRQEFRKTILLNDELANEQYIHLFIDIIISDQKTTDSAQLNDSSGRT
jgi:hypothetical protein